MLITRRVEFSASHVCHNPNLSEEQNRALYGQAANPHGHGHNYVLEVTLEGEPMDQRFLNREVPPFDRVVPTAENLALEVWRRLEPHLNTGGARLQGVRVYETEDLYVDYFGEAS